MLLTSPKCLPVKSRCLSQIKAHAYILHVMQTWQRHALDLQRNILQLCRQTLGKPNATFSNWIFGLSYVHASCHECSVPLFGDACSATSRIVSMPLGSVRANEFCTYSCKPGLHMSQKPLMSCRYRFKDKWLLRQVSSTKLLCHGICRCFREGSVPANSYTHSKSALPAHSGPQPFYIAMLLVQSNDIAGVHSCICWGVQLHAPGLDWWGAPCSMSCSS